MAIWDILQTFGIYYNHLVHFGFIWYIFPLFWYHVTRKIWQPRSYVEREIDDKVEREKNSAVYRLLAKLSSDESHLNGSLLSFRLLVLLKGYLGQSWSSGGTLGY
jgi:hypothetical protein